MSKRPPAGDRIKVVGASGEPGVREVIVDPTLPDEPVPPTDAMAAVEEVQPGTGTIGIDVHQEGALPSHGLSHRSRRPSWTF